MLKRFLVAYLGVGIACALLPANAQSQLTPAPVVSIRPAGTMSLPPGIYSEADIRALAAQLPDPKKRPHAISVLYAVSRSWDYLSGTVPPDTNELGYKLTSEARAALEPYETMENVRRALLSRDSWLQQWGVSVWDDKRRETASEGDAWRAMLPLIEHVEVTGDAAARNFALGSLLGMPEEAAFLQKRLEIETDPYILLRLAYNSDQAIFDQRYNPQLVRVLSSKDESAVLRGLGVVIYDRQLDSSSHVDFDSRVRQRVAALAKSRSRKIHDTALMAQGALMPSPAVAATVISPK